jgi:predicted PurR-regulated permease PerM
VENQPEGKPFHIEWQPLFFKLLLVSTIAAIVLWLLVRLSVVTVPILVGFFIAYALNPMVVWLRRWRVPPVLALTVPVLVVVVLAVLFATIVLPGMAHEVIQASQHAPARLYNAILKADPWFQTYTGQPLSAVVAYSDLSNAMQSLATEIFGPARSTLSWVLSSAREMLLALGNLLLVIVVAFFLLGEYERILRLGGSLVPVRDQQVVARVIRRIDGVLGGFIRGELLLLVLATVVFTGGLALLGVPYALVVGPMVAVIYLVPYVGVVAGVVVCTSLSLMAGHAPLRTLGVVALFFAFYGTDLLYITPRIIGNRVGLRPIAVLLGIIACGELFGPVGVLLAIPLLACGRILLLEVYETYRASPVYLGDLPAPEPSIDPPAEPSERTGE